jgi:sulfatase modifying factor 1
MSQLQRRRRLLGAIAAVAPLVGCLQLIGEPDPGSNSTCPGDSGCEAAPLCGAGDACAGSSPGDSAADVSAVDVRENDSHDEVRPVPAADVVDSPTSDAFAPGDAGGDAPTTDEPDASEEDASNNDVSSDDASGDDAPGDGGTDEGDASGAGDQDASDSGSDAVPPCSAAATQCDSTAKFVETCEADGGWGPLSPCASFCRNGGCVTPASCQLGATSTCGPSALNASCCSSETVVGGSFERSYDGTTDYPDPNYPATVSSFLLDTYEVTVGRFRNFVNAYANALTELTPGAGKNPNNPTDPGWLSSWNANLQPDAGALASQLLGCSGGTWTSQAMSNENMPIDCVDWYTAFAFCIWDGGRLPTEAEWNYAAAGGSQQREYPWPNSVPAITMADAVYSPQAIAPVGSKSPMGDGAWGQSDLSGNLEEWVLDSASESYPTMICDDCADTNYGTLRMARGGSYLEAPDALTASSRDDETAASILYYFGFRCARSTQ